MKTRIITGLTLTVLTLAILFLGEVAFAILVGAMITLACIEVLHSGHENKNWPKRVKVITIILTLLMVFWNIMNNFMVDPTGGLKLASVTLTIPPLGIASTLIVYFLLVILKHSINVEDVSYLFTMSMLLTLGGQSALYTRGIGLIAFIFVAIVSFGTDTGAFFVGSLLGRNKINPRISPKKTYEGAIGGGIIGTLTGIVYAFIFQDQFMKDIIALYPKASLKYFMVYVIAISLILSIFAQVGDFTFSAIKRHYKIKDFGNIFPGHGGVLDRIDSLLINLIVFSIIIINLARGFSWWVG